MDVRGGGGGYLQPMAMQTQDVPKEPKRKNRTKMLQLVKKDIRKANPERISTVLEAVFIATAHTNQLNQYALPRAPISCSPKRKRCSFSPTKSLRRRKKETMGGM